MIEKAGRASKRFLQSLGKSAEGDRNQEAKKAIKRAENWRGISDTDHAKDFIEVCDEMTEITYQRICDVILGDLAQYEEHPAKLVAFAKAMQYRLITIKTLMGIFIPNQQEIEALKEQSQKEE